MKEPPELDVTRKIYALQHIETGEFICLLQDGVDYLACFTDGDTALEFRASLRLEEHVDLYSTTIGRSPFSHFWLDGENVCLKEEAVR
jgi:hypothetical protein